MSFEDEESETLTCAECGFKAQLDLIPHIHKEHGLSNYLISHTGPMTHPVMDEAWKKHNHGVKRTPVFGGEFELLWNGLRVVMSFEIPPEACAPAPKNYILPEHGKAAEQSQRILRYVNERRSVWIYGTPGIGKDALVHYASHKFRRPFKFFSIYPDAKIQDWFWSIGFQGGESTWIEGSLLKALRDGYVDPTGKRHPYLILLSDLDRATPPQVERLRTLLDTDLKRVPLPGGEYAEILEGTTIVATANTMGEGDDTGRIVSARRVDSSILNRFQCKVEMRSLEWEDQHEILKVSHPHSVKILEDHKLLPSLQKIVVAIQNDCSSGAIFAEFSLRDMKNILDEFESLFKMNARDPSKSQSQSQSLESVLMDAFQVYIDGLGQRESKNAVVALIQPHLKSTTLFSGDTDHILWDDLKL